MLSPLGAMAVYLWLQYRRSQVTVLLVAMIGLTLAHVLGTRFVFERHFHGVLAVTVVFLSAMQDERPRWAWAGLNLFGVASFGHDTIRIFG